MPQIGTNESERYRDTCEGTGREKIEYKILDSNTADVYAELVFSEIAKECDKAGCTIINMDEHDESLEAFYLSLLVGNENV